MDISLGKQISIQNKELKTEVDQARSEGFDFIVSVINNGNTTFDPVADISMPSKIWTDRILIDLSPFSLEGYDPASIGFFRRLLRYALYLPSVVIIIKCPKTTLGCLHLAPVINQTLKETRESRCQEPLIVFRLNLHATKDSRLSPTECSPITNLGNERNGIHKALDNRSDTTLIDPWIFWNTLVTYLAIDRRIGVALTIDGDLPEKSQRRRWLGEPVKIIFLETSIFKANDHGLPVLPSSYQDYIYELTNSQSFKVSLVATSEKKENWKEFGEYLRDFRKILKDRCRDPHFDKGDMLQLPLQPLARDLESVTYNVFEQDPIKYDKYQLAIQEAIIELTRCFETEHGSPTIEESFDKHSNFNPVIMVVGAGRGPLVSRSLKAATTCRCFATIYVIEKNPNSIVTLEYLISQLAEEFPINRKITNSHQIKLVNTDMRGWSPDNGDKADIVVSELLGSFSDNELSPECLDGLWKVTKRDTICIPLEYSSYICPIMYGVVHQQICEQQLETMFVSKLANHYRIDKPRELFNFRHEDMTRDPKTRDHSRYKVVRFKNSTDIVCHGFGGYFETTLYGDIKLSIVPGRETPGLISWFPMYIPIVQPVRLSPNQELVVHFWRVTTNVRVWYEWAISSPEHSKIYSLDSSRVSSRAISKNYECVH